jgi:hypothetical protein
VLEASVCEASRSESVVARYAPETLVIVRPHWETTLLEGWPLVWVRGRARSLSRGLLLQLPLLRLLFIWLSVLRVLVLRRSGLPVPQRIFRHLRIFWRDGNVRLLRSPSCEGSSGGGLACVELISTGKTANVTTPGQSSQGPEPCPEVPRRLFVGTSLEAHHQTGCYCAVIGICAGASRYICPFSLHRTRPIIRGF